MGRREPGVPVDVSPEELYKRALSKYLKDCAATCRSDKGRGHVEVPARERRDYEPPREPMFAGAGGLRLLLAIPGLVDQFDREVPETHLDRDDRESIVVTCPCSSTTAALPQEAVACEGGCGRYFLRVRGTLTPVDVVLVAKFPLEDETEAEAA